MAKLTDVGGGLGTATPPLQNTSDLPTSNTGTLNTGTTGFGASGTVGGTSNTSFGNTSFGNTGGIGQPNQGQQSQESQSTAQQVKDLASDAKQQTVKMAGQARDQVQELVERQKDQAAERLGGLAGALREAANKLQEGDQGANFGQYADRAAEQVERLSGYLRDSDLRGFVRDTESFARRRPEVFLGGTLLAGLMLARFLKSSAPERPDRGPYSAGYRASLPQDRSTYAPQRRNPDQGTYGVDAGTPSYNAPMGV